MKKILAILALALIPFATQARELSHEQEQEMLVFCDIIAETAGSAAKAREEGTSLVEYQKTLAAAIKQMKQPYDWTETKVRTLRNTAALVYTDLTLLRFTPRQTKRWFDAACISEAYK